MDYFLKAANEAELRAALIDAGILVIEPAAVNAENEVILPAHERVADGLVIDIIGTIYKPTGNTLTVDGMDVPEMAAIPGYHANLRGELFHNQLLTLDPILLPVPPDQPYRVWA